MADSGLDNDTFRKLELKITSEDEKPSTDIIDKRKPEEDIALVDDEEDDGEIDDEDGLDQSKGKKEIINISDDTKVKDDNEQTVIEVETKHDDEEDDKETTETPLLDDDLKKDNLPGDDTPTLPMSKKSKESIIPESIELPTRKPKPPKYIFPLTRMRIAWTTSANTLEFLVRAVGIIFSTLGWLFCVGGVPLLSIVMLIVGCIFVNDCNIQPKIPIYLIVSGVFGTLQHFIAIWTRYIPKERQGKLKKYRAYCYVVDCTLEFFLIIWFILGCVWVYGAHSDVDYEDTFKDEYCNKHLYLFAFWILNISFILFSFLIMMTICCILCIVSTSKDEEKGVVQP